ncbi:hypothetical protein K7X08_035480 [Anisodus acutangulus]|uniref:Uncharacterized protein n=1 Tax=Anisodus acutangulus TaxID=402998 RepID=A0A9Q1LL66_9SOLA|nr:hypothetical protein K7X08_035480 [Anisodus acutangulus]
MNKLIEAFEKAGLNFQFESVAGDNDGTEDIDFVDFSTLVEEGRKKKIRSYTRALLFKRIIKESVLLRRSLDHLLDHKEDYCSHHMLMRLLILNDHLIFKVKIDVVDSPPNDFGGEDFDGVDFGGGAIEVMLDDVVQVDNEVVLSPANIAEDCVDGGTTEVGLNDVGGASTEQVVKEGDLFSGNFVEDHLDGGASEVVLNNFGGASIEQVAEEGGLSSENVVEPVAKREKWLRFRFKFGVVNQYRIELENDAGSSKSIVAVGHHILVCNYFTGKTVVPESVACTLGESGDIGERSIKSQNAPDRVARGTPVESPDVSEGSVQSQCGESSEESDDDFADIMDIASSAVNMACDIMNHAATKTDKQ